jgi:hypothetical protein
MLQTGRKASVTELKPDIREGRRLTWSGKFDQALCSKATLRSSPANHPVLRGCSVRGCRLWMMLTAPREIRAGAPTRGLLKQANSSVTSCGYGSISTHPTMAWLADGTRSYHREAVPASETAHGLGCASADQRSPANAQGDFCARYHA